MTTEPFTTIEPAPGDLDQVLDVAQSAQVPEPIPHTPYVSVITRNGHTLHLLNTDSLNDQDPSYKAGLASFTRPDSFAAYVKTHETEATTCWVTGDTITAVFDDDTPTSPGRRGHRATLNLARSRVVNALVNADGRAFTQQDFGEWLEQWGAWVAVPDAATLMETVLTMEQTRKVEWRSAVRLADGQRQLQYQETIATKAGASGQATVPDTLVFAPEPFEGVDPTGARLIAKLRYRVVDGKLQVSFLLVAFTDWLSAQLESVVDQLTADTESVYYWGEPPKPWNPPVDIASFRDGEPC